MEWLTEIMKSPAPVAFVLGGGCVALWRAYLASNAAHIADLKDIAKGAQRRDSEKN